MNLATQLNPAASPARARAAAATYDLDAAHSHVGFAVRHMMVSNVRGEFKTLAGTVTYDPSAPENTALDVKIDVASVNTREEKRDEHLRSADFFDAAKFPHITFVSKQTRKSGDGLELKGDLTIAGTTREVTLAVEDITPEHADPWGKQRMGASARTKIRRADFGMRWNAALEAGGGLVGDEITVTLDVELIRR
jgi:polyisoprenoid-binding protein YceI